ncbi:MAG: EcsC family protein [Clostridium sp.]|uniref:EcsC family protein n=1 Tax=Clostridium sp. TaxID=1506 RepID=UPI0025BA9D9B|nr:EcsC family protein [Clostridium sp.]MCE5220339.1 EcsC family protein [Clostridium sp.]
MRDKDFKEKRVILSQKNKLMKREDKLLNKKENLYIKNKISPIKEKLEEKIPAKMIDTFQKAFEKGFYYVFKKGTVIIEKSYNLEKLKNEADINEYILFKQINNKNLNRIDKKAKKGAFINKGITTVEGVGLGVLGIGFPDIPVFIGIILKTVYEICLNYGFNYDSEEEKAFVLNIICTSANKTAERILYSNEADRIGYNIDNNFHNEVDMNKMIEVTSRNLSENIILSKIIQGVPIIGVYGGISNYILIRDISKIASIKYKKRLLLKL